ncbi:MAG TPA: hypothetical protein VER96_12910 [Polyangiaceae bacterium]|nr:hypothetical protein [Polyangiaceae bacterium]
MHQRSISVSRGGNPRSIKGGTREDAAGNGKHWTDRYMAPKGKLTVRSEARSKASSATPGDGIVVD